MTDSTDTVILPLGAANGELVAVEAGVNLLRKTDLGGGQVVTDEGEGDPVEGNLDQLLETLDGAINDAYSDDPGDQARPDPVPVPVTVPTAVLLCRLFAAAGRLGPDGVAMAAMHAGLRFDGTAEDFQAMHAQWADVAGRIEALLPPDARRLVHEPDSSA